MHSLSDFLKPNGAPLFRDAQNLPAFFEHNLVHPARVVKVLQNDPQASIRVFYYQYLKLCFELETVNYEFYINKIEEIINNKEFKFMFYEDDDPALYNDNQFKHLIMEFFGVLGQGELSIEAALAAYPIMDTVFIYFFRAILILTGKTDSLDSYVNREDLFDFFRSQFVVDISVHDRCVKFVETDIFVYEENPQLVFMAYMDYENQPYNANPLQKSYSQHEVSVPTSPLPHPQQQYNAYNHVAASPIVQMPVTLQPEPNRRANTQINQSYIASEFVDYTTPTAFGSNLNNLVKTKNLKESGPLQTKPTPLTPVVQIPTFPTPPYKNSYSDYQSDNSESKSQFSYGKQALNTNFNTNIIKTDISIDFPSVQKVEEISYSWQPTKDPGFSTKPNDYSKPFDTSFLKTDFKNDYKSDFKNEYKAEMKKPTSYAPVIGESRAMIQSKKPGSYDPIQGSASYVSSLQSNKNVFNLNVSQQFTNSFTMKAMSEPHKSNVVSIRQRARNYRNSLVPFIK